MRISEKSAFGAAGPADAEWFLGSLCGGPRQTQRLDAVAAVRKILNRRVRQEKAPKNDETPPNPPLSKNLVKPLNEPKLA
jgi:hypothetical protein